MRSRFIRRIRKILLQDEKEKYRRASKDIPAISLQEVEEVRDFFPLKKFFIFGHARSGTTLLARLIRLHPQVHCNWQAHFFTRPPLLESLVSEKEVGEWLSRRSNRWNQGRDLSPLVLRVVSDFILEREARQAGKTIVGDKSPNSLLNGASVERLYKVYPDARLIFIVRDGRDAVISHRIQAFIDKSEELSQEDMLLREAFMKDPRKFLAEPKSLFTDKGLRAAAARWRENVFETDRLGKALLSEHYISLRYEDLLARPFDEVRRLWEFLEVDQITSDLRTEVEAEMSVNPDADWQQEAARDLTQWLRKGEPGVWREVMTPADQMIFAEMAGDVLKAWGYEL